MNRFRCFIGLAGLVLAWSVVCFAVEDEEGGQKMKPKGPMGPMMNMMSARSMITTADGGIVIMTGNKLLKYDKDLNLIKEAEIKMDAGDMNKMMMDKKEQHPIREEDEQMEELPEESNIQPEKAY